MVGLLISGVVSRLRVLNTTVQENICFQPLAHVEIELISSRLGDYIPRLR